MGVDVFMHFAVSFLVLFPVAYAWLSLSKTRKKSKFAKNLFLLSASLLPLAFYHFLEGLDAYGLGPFLPPEGSFEHTTIEHMVIGIAFFALGLFCRWVHNTYIAPIHSIKNVFKKK